MEDPYSTTNVYDLDLDVGSVATVTVKQQHPAPARTLQTAERIVVAGARIRDADDLQAAKDLAERLDGVFGVTRAVVDRGLADGPVVGRIDEHVAPKLLVCVGCTGSLEFLDAVDSEPTLVAVGSGDEDPINDRCAYRVAGTVKEAVKEILSGL